MKILKCISVLLAIIIIVGSWVLISIYSNKTKITLVECIDGDTAKFIINNKQENVRFLGINTPEFTNKQEEYGYEASNYTCELLEGASNIYIEYDSNSDKRDKYNRVLGWIFVDNNNLSELLLSRGYAEVKYVYGDYKYIDNLCRVQSKAYEDRLGIWNINYSEYKDNYCFKDNY